MDKKAPLGGIRMLFVCLQGLMTIGLLIYGFGLGYSVTEPIPAALVLGFFSGTATFGLVRRKRWTWIPAMILILAIGFLATISIGISSVWLSRLDSILAVVFGGILVIPTGTVLVSRLNKTK